jgi:hypothetical protein
MSSNHEFIEAKNCDDVEWYGPGQNLGDTDDTVPAGHYALGISLSGGGLFITGTINELESFVGGVGGAYSRAYDDSVAPLTLADFTPDDDDPLYECPRCVDPLYFEMRDYSDVAALVAAIELHIATHNAPKPT